MSKSNGSELFQAQGSMILAALLSSQEVDSHWLEFLIAMAQGGSTSQLLHYNKMNHTAET